MAPGQAAHHEAAEDGGAALLVDQHVRVLLREQLVAGLREDPQRDLVRHRRRRQEDGGLVAEEGGGAPLELEDGRVLAVLLVADLGVRDRLAHGGVGRVIVSERRSITISDATESPATVVGWT